MFYPHFIDRQTVSKVTDLNTGRAGIRTKMLLFSHQMFPEKDSYGYFSLVDRNWFSWQEDNQHIPNRAIGL